MTTQNVHTYLVTKDFLEIDVQSLSIDNGSKLLFKYRERDPADENEQQAAEEISEFVGGLRLTIAVIGGYINQSGSQVQGFLANPKRSSTVWTASATGPAEQYDKTLRSVFNVALSEAPDRTREFLNILAFLDPDRKPEWMFFAHFKKPVIDISLKYVTTDCEQIHPGHFDPPPSTAHSSRRESMCGSISLDTPHGSMICPP
jgi:hypothetical protein